MRPLGNKDIEAELSYAYLHAVASHAGMACQVANRAMDNNGIDALLKAWGPFPNTYRRQVSFDIQLKATIERPGDVGDHFSYWMPDNGLKRYDDLREETDDVQRLLVCCFCPPSRKIG